MEACRDLLNSAPTCCTNSHQLSEISKTGAAFLFIIAHKNTSSPDLGDSGDSERNKEKEEVRLQLMDCDSVSEGKEEGSSSACKLN